jgi:hypothetical protein
MENITLKVEEMQVTAKSTPVAESASTTPSVPSDSSKSTQSAQPAPRDSEKKPKSGVTVPAASDRSEIPQWIKAADFKLEDYIFTVSFSLF